MMSFFDRTFAAAGPFLAGRWPGLALAHAAAHGRGPGGGPFDRRHGPRGFPPGGFPRPGGYPPFGFPFGGWAGQAFRRWPKMGRGDIRHAVLDLLSEEPQHGYQLIQEIRGRSGGLWRPSAGSIYPTLRQLEAEGLVAAERSGGRRVFQLTESGRTYVGEHEEDIAAVWDTVGDGVDDGMLELGEIASEVGAAVAHIARAGSAKHITEATDVLAATRRRLYHLLADGDQQTSDDS